jgi:hypothetical protein
MALGMYEAHYGFVQVLVLYTLGLVCKSSSGSLKDLIKSIVNTISVSPEDVENDTKLCGIMGDAESPFRDLTFRTLTKFNWPVVDQFDIHVSGPTPGGIYKLFFNAVTDMGSGDMVVQPDVYARLKEHIEGCEDVLYAAKKQSTPDSWKAFLELLLPFVSNLTERRIERTPELEDFLSVAAELEGSEPDLFTRATQHPSEFAAQVATYLLEQL